MKYLDLRRIKPVKAVIKNDKIVFEKNISIHSTMDDLFGMSLGVLKLSDAEVLRTQIQYVPDTILLMVIMTGTEDSSVGSINKGWFVMNCAELSNGRETIKSNFLRSVPWVTSAEGGRIFHLSNYDESSFMTVNKNHCYNDKFLEFTIRK